MTGGGTDMERPSRCDVDGEREERHRQADSPEHGEEVRHVRPWEHTSERFRKWKY